MIGGFRAFFAGTIWWIWTAYPSWHPARVHTFSITEAWGMDDPDVAWLGEGAYDWTDNMGLRIKTAR